MSSPELLKQQMKRWLEKQRNKSDEKRISIEPIKEEIASLKDKEDRYARAYGAGAIDLAQLSEYTGEIRKRVSSLEQNLVTQEPVRGENVTLPSTEDELEAFAGQAAAALGDLNFEAKRLIVMNTIDRVIVDQNELKISGAIPVRSTTDVTLRPIHRHRGNTTRQPISPERYPESLIPFEFIIPVPAPQYERVIIARDERGRIKRSVSPPSECSQ